ncbi:MAG: hypothetical protein EXX96DRAFT_479676, partial [Benjaminiella poitrasii]
EIEDNFAVLLLEEEDFQLIQINHKSYSHAQIASFIHSLQEEGCLVQITITMDRLDQLGFRVMFPPYLRKEHWKG